jgi:hypothetical protein
MKAIAENRILILLVLLMTALSLSPATADSHDDEAGSTRSGIGTSLSYSVILTTHWMRSALPVGPEVYGRFFDLFEAGLFGTYGFGTSRRYESYWSIVAGAELRLAPAGKVYMPYAGLGLAYAFYQHQVVLPDDHMITTYVSIAPLRFSLRSLFRIKADIHPIVSALQMRYGPLFFDGGLPSWFDGGSFITTVDLIRVGVFFGL